MKGTIRKGGENKLGFFLFCPNCLFFPRQPPAAFSIPRDPGIPRRRAGLTRCALSLAFLHISQTGHMPGCDRQQLISVIEPFNRSVLERFKLSQSATVLCPHPPS